MQGNLKYIDLFAGCGGLSLGLEQAGFNLRFAVEKSEMAAETFYHNFIRRIGPQDKNCYKTHLSLPVQEQAAGGLIVSPLSSVLEERRLLEQLREEDIDLVAGGPPCQGFSLAGRRNPKDERNKLAWQFLDFIQVISPKAVLIENVAGMRQDFRKHGSEAAFDQLRSALEQVGPGYCVQPMLLNAMHFGAAQHRPRVMLVGLRADIALRVGASASEKLWRSCFADEEVFGSNRPFMAPVPTIDRAGVCTVRDAIADLLGNANTKGRSTYASQLATDQGWMPERVRRSLPKGRSLSNHRRRAHSEKVEQRFRVYQALAGQGVSPDLLSYKFQEAARESGVSSFEKAISQLIDFPLVSIDGLMLANNASEAAKVFQELATKKHSQRALSWDKPSPTVLSIPDDFVHPCEPRAMTVRELARFQSFPDAFEFRGKETTGGLKRRTEVPQYTQVGNAVPPKLALAVGMQLSAVLAIAALSVDAAESEAA